MAVNLDKILRYQQKDHWCGPASIQMVLASAGKKVSQEAIAKDVILDWWGTTQDAIYAYLSKYFEKLNFKTNSKLEDLFSHLVKGHTIMVNWWDDLDKEEDADGHYSLILNYDKNAKIVTLGDPSVGRGIWKMDSKEFNNRWYDYLDVHYKKWIAGWLLWVDPKSVRKGINK